MVFHENPEPHKFTEKASVKMMEEKLACGMLITSLLELIRAAI